MKFQRGDKVVSIQTIDLSSDRVLRIGSPCTLPIQTVIHATPDLFITDQDLTSFELSVALKNNDNLFSIGYSQETGQRFTEPDTVIYHGVHDLEQIRAVLNRHRNKIEKLNSEAFEHRWNILRPFRKETNADEANDKFAKSLLDYLIEYGKEYRENQIYIPSRDSDIAEFGESLGYFASFEAYKEHQYGKVTDVPIFNEGTIENELFKETPLVTNYQVETTLTPVRPTEPRKNVSARSLFEELLEERLTVNQRANQEPETRQDRRRSFLEEQHGTTSEPKDSLMRQFNRSKAKSTHQELPSRNSYRLAMGHN